MLHLCNFSASHESRSKGLQDLKFDAIRFFGEPDLLMRTVMSNVRYKDAGLISTISAATIQARKGRELQTAVKLTST
jgi:hypothetical protein